MIRPAVVATLGFAMMHATHRHPAAVLAFHVAPPSSTRSYSSSSSSSSSSTVPSFVNIASTAAASCSPPTPPPSRATRRVVGGVCVALARRTSSSLSSSTSDVAYDVVSLSLAKPLGLILEESDDDSGGVVVAGINEGGSAHELSSSIRDGLTNAKISSVMGVDVASSSFDDVMDAIVGAPSTVDIAFRVTSSSSSSSPSYEVGAIVDIIVQQPFASPTKSDVVIKAKVGDNLRKTLLSDGNVELYRGLKKKLGNCGGGGQCGFCAVELIDETGVWGTRGDYEAKKIGKNGNENCRLACMNNIVGPATVRTL